MIMELKIEEITKNYKNKCALNQLSLTLTPGIYGLLGPNGAGKSTLMNIIVGNLKSSKGQILYNGNNIVTLGRHYRKLIGYMPQQQRMYEYFTGYRFLSYMAALKGMSSKAAQLQIKAAADQVNLTEQLGRKIGSYSGGMKQRLLIAQAILDEPEIIVLDEPTAGLDPKERIRIRNLISEIAMNKIVILATHVVQDIEYIAKEIIFLKNGNLVNHSTAEQLIQKMNNRVYEVICSQQQIPEIQSAYAVTNITKNGMQVLLHIISESEPKGYQYKKIIPNLEDCYLYEFTDF